MHLRTMLMLGFSGAAVGSDSIPSFQKQTLLELLRVKVEDKLQPIQEGEYYAVEYQKAFYIGRVLRNKNATLTIKFLHSVGVWPAQMWWHWRLLPLLANLWFTSNPRKWSTPISSVGRGTTRLPVYKEEQEEMNIELLCVKANIYRWSINTY